MIENGKVVAYRTKVKVSLKYAKAKTDSRGRRRQTGRRSAVERDAALETVRRSCPAWWCISAGASRL
ncbi:MAG TPA: hypothetical protein VKG91_15910 [Roseiarcus sp.]|nr:hypothetical protein [Roseiarcus sp.]